MIAASIPLMTQDLAALLPERLEQIRKENGLTQVQVAQALGTTQGTYAQYESGTRGVSLKILPKLAEALGTSTEELLGLNEKRSKRGPLSAWEKRIDAIKKLPRDKQQEIQNVVDALISKAP